MRPRQILPYFSHKSCRKNRSSNRIRTLPYGRNNAIHPAKPERVLLRPPQRGEKTEKIFTTDDRCIKKLFNTTIYLAKDQTKRGSATLYIYTPPSRILKRHRPRAKKHRFAPQRHSDIIKKQKATRIHTNTLNTNQLILLL